MKGKKGFKNDEIEQERNTKKGQRTNLSENDVITVSTANVHQEVQRGGGYPSCNGPDKGQRYQGVRGEECEEDIPGVVAFSPAEDGQQALKGLRCPGEQGQAPAGGAQETQNIVNYL